MFSRRRRRGIAGPLGIDIFELGSPYTGQVATNSYIPSNRSASLLQANSRSHHVARDDISAVQIELPNWCWLRSGVGPETNGGGTLTVTAAIEWNGGVAQVLFSAATSSVIADGGSVLSDSLVLPTRIPSGDHFWVRSFQVGSVATVFLNGDVARPFSMVDVANGEVFETAASGLSDRTMTPGTFTSTSVANDASIYRPTAIVGSTKRPSFALFGDSRVWGFDDGYDSEGNLGEHARFLGRRFGYINVGCSGDTFSAFNAGSVKRRALNQYCSHIIMGGGINTLRSGGAGQNKTSANAQTDLQTGLALFAGLGKKRGVCTVAPNSSGAWTLTSGSDQTVNANQTQINLYNTALRAGIANTDATIDIEAGFTMAGLPGKWKANGVAQAYSISGLHSTKLGYQENANNAAQWPVTFLKR